MQATGTADHRELPILRITNLGAGEHVVSLTMQLPGAATATEAQSGALAPGDSYVVKMSPVEGAVTTLSDPTDPSIQGSITLVEPVPGEVRLHFMAK